MADPNTTDEIKKVLQRENGTLITLTASPRQVALPSRLGTEYAEGMLEWRTPDGDEVDEFEDGTFLVVRTGEILIEPSSSKKP